MALTDRLLAATLPIVPKPIVRRVAARYVAGPTLVDAVRKVEELGSAGLCATVALLGEEVRERAQVETAVAEYARLVEALARPELCTGISIKLTLLGLEIDRDYCRDNLFAVAEAARRADLFVRIDMEDHTTTDATLELYHEAQSRYGNLGIVLQAYLRRTLADIACLPPETSVRLCKGIYVEPEAVAFRDDDEIRARFVLALDRLLERGCTVGIATHDRYLIDHARRLVAQYAVSAPQVEFQTLLGVTEALRDELREEGHRLRVYIPYGRDWYAYSIRRLRENPKIAMYVLRALFSGRSRG
jgi:proline dehydrogenase